MNKTRLLAIVLIMMMVSCKTTHTLFGNKTKPATVEVIEEKLTVNYINFITFSGKAKVDVASSAINQSFSAQIDMLKDSVIGLSLRVMGVEGARIKITPDSIEIIDRLNQEYIPRSYSFIRDNFNLDISFTDLQSLIAGNPVFYGNTTKTVGESDDKYVLFAQNDVYKNTIWLSPNFDILRMFIEDLVAKRTLTLSYSAHEKIQGRQFAFIRNIQVDATETLSSNIEFSKVEFDQPFGFTFSVNPKYTRID
jgi:hypothetical protein